MVTAVAVALAESGGDTNAQSGTADWGLWQINAVHAWRFGGNMAGALNPEANAYAAVAISNAGSNWAPWAVCYPTPFPGWATYLAGPLPGSAAAGRIAEVAAALGASSPGTCGPHEIGIPNALVANLQPGQCIETYTCPGGPFDAGDLQDGLDVSYYINGQRFTVSNDSSGTFVPAGAWVQVCRRGASPQPQPQPTPAGCGPNDIGIPSGIVNNLLVGQSLNTTTCPGGWFAAATLQPGLEVRFTIDGVEFIVASTTANVLIPPSHPVRITRFAGGPPAPVTPFPQPSPQPSPGPGPSPEPPPVVYGPWRPPDAPSGQVSIEHAWSELQNWTNEQQPGVVSSFRGLSDFARRLG